MKVVQGLLGVAGIAVVAWSAITAWGAVVHGHPAYAVLLVLTLAGSVVLLVRAFRQRPPARGWRLALGIVGALLGVAWLAAISWLRPLPAVEPALAAMLSTGTVTVTETATEIVMQPGLDPIETGLVFQPGAKVDPRAYAAILRPLVDAGYTVIIPKQPLGIAFLAQGAFDGARDGHAEIDRWVVGGHSLGGTVAAMTADAHDEDPTAPVAGLLLYASYPAADVSTTLVADVLSVSASNDGLATPADIAASRELLPPEAWFEEVEGAVHASFGDYGAQPGDGTATIPPDEARSRIGQLSLDFLRGVGSPA